MKSLRVQIDHTAQQFAFRVEHVTVFDGGGTHGAFDFRCGSAQTHKFVFLFNAEGNHIVHHALIQLVFGGIIGEAEVHRIQSVFAFDGADETAQFLIVVVAPNLEFVFHGSNKCVEHG